MTADYLAFIQDLNSLALSLYDPIAFQYMEYLRFLG